MKLNPDSVWFTIFLGALIGLTAMSIDIVLPALLRLTEDLATSQATAQHTISVFMLGYAAGQLMWGPVSDRFGRKPVLIIGLSLYAVASLACFLSITIEQVIGFRFLQAIGASVGAVIGRAIVRDYHEGIEGARLLSHMTAIMAFAIVFAPLVGAYILVLFDWRAIFVFMFLTGLVFLSITKFLPEPSRNDIRHDSALEQLLSDALNFFRHKSCVLSVVVVSLSGGVLFLYVAGSPYFFMTVFGLSSQDFGYVFAFIGLAYGGAAWFNGQLIRRLGLRFLLAQGAGLVFAGSVLLLLLSLSAAPSFWGSVFAMMLVEAGVATLIPTVTVVALQPYPQAAGLAASVVGAAQIGSSALAAAAVTLTFDGTPFLLMRSFFVLGSLLGIGVWALIVVSSGSLQAGQRRRAG